MAESTCLICDRSSQTGNCSPTLELSLAEFRRAALNCGSCGFVAALLEEDEATPADVEDTATIRVDNGGRRFTGQWHGALVTELYEPGVEPVLPIPREIPAKLSCDLAADIIRGWMMTCQEHTECNEDNFFAFIDNLKSKDLPYSKKETPSIETILPARLIKLDEKATRGVLEACKPGFSPPYAALSYRWGGVGMFMTESHTLKQYEDQGFRICDLPKTLSDACQLAKALGLEYLWIDAICIVQGDLAEWEVESSKMGHIYSNARIVISAARSADADQGLFLSRPDIRLSHDVEGPGGIVFARRNHNHEIITSCRTKSNRWWEMYINTTFPLLSRGWGFQERMLATRIVHFTPTELVWECQKTRKCECQVVESNLFPAMNNMSSALRMCLTQPLDDRSTRQIWREIVNSYSVRKLTRIDDKLPALSGIASLLKAKTGDMYVAGLWKRSLPYDLLWRCDQSGVLKSKKDRVPSWSWISVDGAVKWPVSQHADNSQPLKYINSTTYFECGADCVDVLDVQCQLEGRDEYGRVRSANIKLLTRMVPATIELNPDKEWDAQYGTEWAIRVKDSELAPFWPDINEEGLRQHLAGGAKSHELKAVEIMRPREEPGSWEESLIVRLKENLADGVLGYERVGVAANVGRSSQWRTLKGWFHSISPEIVTLV